MNIEDVKENPGRVENHLKHIFDKQEELMEKYQEIEGLPEWPVSIDLAENQVVIKDFKQRGMEEIAEAIEAFRNEEELHFKEELIDALHFFVELNILVGKKYNYFDKGYDIKGYGITLDELYSIYGRLGEKYGLLCNTLKNKPWKNTQMRTDKTLFNKLLKEAFEYFIYMLNRCGMDMEEIYNIYFKKHKVNQFRIRSNY